MSAMLKIKDRGGTPLTVGAKCCVYLASAESDGITGRLIAAQWDPWPFTEEVKRDIAETDIYTLRRIVPKDRGKPWGRSDAAGDRRLRADRRRSARPRPSPRDRRGLRPGSPARRRPGREDRRARRDGLA